LLKLMKSALPGNFACFEGEYYVKDRRGLVDYLLIITEAGDFSLREIFNCRLEGKIPGGESRDCVYNPEQVISFLYSIMPAYEFMRKSSISYCNTNLENFVFSYQKKGFLLKNLDFSDLVEAHDSAIGVPMSYCRWLEKEGAKPPEIQMIASSNSFDGDSRLYSPFKSDMWDLGVTLEKMSGAMDEALPGGEFLKQVIKKLKENDWKKRFDIGDLRRFMESYPCPRLSLVDMERVYLEKLVAKRNKRHSLSIGLFKNDFSPEDELNMALRDFTRLKRIFGECCDQNELEFEKAFQHLGKLIIDCLMLCRFIDFVENLENLFILKYILL
jgi:hypothetical protein